MILLSVLPSGPSPRKMQKKKKKKRKQKEKRKKKERKKMKVGFFRAGFWREQDDQQK